MTESNVSWQDAVKSWLYDTIEKSPATIDNERFVLNALDKSFAGKPIASIDAEAIARHARSRFDAGSKPRTINRDLRVLRAVLRAANRRGDLPTLPAIKMIRVTTKRLRWITYQQSRRLFDHLPPHQVAPVAFALETGLRKTNVAQLRWDQIDMQRCVAWIHPDQAKARKAIAVPLSKTAMTILKGQHGQHAHRVFIYRGRPFKELNTKAYRAALKAAGIEDFTWHDLRRTWASWHAQNGTPMNALQELGGWSDPSMLNVYAHLSVDHLRRYVATNHARVRDRSP